MGFKAGAYAKVWEVVPRSENVTELRISTSRKNKESGEYEQDFGGYVRCVGANCAKKAAALKEGARIRFGDTDVTRRYDKEAQKEYTNFVVFGFEDADSPEAQGTRTNGANVGQRAPAAPKSEPAAPEGDTDDLPF